MLSEKELDQLDELLLSMPIEADGMLLSEFDGFCAGLIVSPEMILPSEWLPFVWGDMGDERFETLESVQQATDLIMRHYNSVAQDLSPPAPKYGPLIDKDTRNGDLIWEPWVAGFETAMSLRPESWEAIMDSGDEDAAACVTMVLELHYIAEGESQLTETQINALRKEAPDLLAEMVLTLNAWTKGQARSEPFPSMFAANTPQAPFSGKKVGRNEPCPCGSGRKYKRCCGGN